MITIGIIGSMGKSAVSEVIFNILKKEDKNVYIIGTHQESNIEFENLLKNDIEYVLIEISREDIIGKRLNSIKFDIIIHTSFKEESNIMIEETQRFINNVREGGYVIFNSDSIQKINFVCDKIYPITYGLNGKTAVTASSIDDINALCFSYCLQRSIYTINEKLIQPFEKPVKINSENKNVYYYLAAFTCTIILGFEF